jgi:hypothetical protein
MGLRLTEYWRSCGHCLVKIAQSLLVFIKSLESDHRAVDVDPSGIATYSVAVRSDTAASLESPDGLFLLSNFRPDEIAPIYKTVNSDQYLTANQNLVRCQYQTSGRTRTS